MPFHERQTIISNLGIVDEVIDFDDDQEGSCCAALEKIKTMDFGRCGRFGFI